MNSSINEISSINPISFINEISDEAPTPAEENRFKNGLIQLLETLNQPGRVPAGVINSLIEQGQDLSPLFLDLIQHITANFQTVGIQYRIDHITILFILAKFKEQNTFPYLIKIASLYRDWPEKFLGDMINDGLANLLVSTYNGDLPAIKTVIENQYADIWCRIACLNTLQGLFALDILKRQDLLDYYSYLLQTELVKDGEFVLFLIININALYPAELFDKIEPFFSKKYFDSSFFNKKCAEDTLALGLDECLKKNIYSNKYILPVDNVIDHVSWLYKKEKNNKNENIKIGRNDACPCDSGKKYKKCCLAISNL